MPEWHVNPGVNIAGMTVSTCGGLYFNFRPFAGGSVSRNGGSASSGIGGQYGPESTGFFFKINHQLSLMHLTLYPPGVS